MKNHSRSSAHQEKVSEQARSLIAATSHIADAKVAEAREKLSQILEQAEAAIDFVEDQAVATARRTDEFIRQKPYQAAGLAMGIGALIGFCIARRK
jgi:ElaB/YqjD/DUF883 family membrane-anchored ribosome-binding protein